ncbi:MAG: HD domain-containing protein [Clostridiales bacterium]|nr:HD domain-containing protein [Clostridiales bacterium]
MNVSEIAARMIAYSNGDLHRINHLMKVYAYAKTIGECEKLDSKTQTVLEVAAIVHDIAIPLCLEKYGSSDGPYQEAEGAVLAAEFLDGCGCSDELKDRVAFLVGHHHTLKGITGPDYQILVEADFLVNADEHHLSQDTIRHMMDSVFRTDTGIALLKTMYSLA